MKFLHKIKLPCVQSRQLGYEQTHQIHFHFIVFTLVD